MNFRSPFLLEHAAEVTDLQWLIVRTLGFLVMVAIVWRFVIPVIRGMLVDRLNAIVNAENQRATTLAETVALCDDYRSRLERIETETSERLEIAVREAGGLRDHILREAEGASSAIVSRAEAEVAMERAKAYSHLRAEFAASVVGAASNAADKSLTQPRQASLVAKFVADLEVGA